MPVQKEVDGLALGDIATIVVNPKCISQCALDIVEVLVNQKHYTGIYVTVNRPYKSLCAALAKQGIDANNLFFIDMITLNVTGSATAQSNCYFANAPTSVMEIAATLTRVATEAPHVRFFILDSVGTLAMYNSTESISKFVHFITTALRELKMEGILLAPEQETDEKLLGFLHSLSDKVIKEGAT